MANEFTPEVLCSCGEKTAKVSGFGIPENTLWCRGCMQNVKDCTCENSDEA